jgi:hypothetical protein
MGKERDLAPVFAEISSMNRDSLENKSAAHGRFPDHVGDGGAALRPIERHNFKNNLEVLYGERVAKTTSVICPERLREAA